MGWTNPWVLTANRWLLLVLASVLPGSRPGSPEPMFRFEPVQDPRVHSSATSPACSRAGSRRSDVHPDHLVRGIWLPRHGYSFESTPLWAGIFVLPMTVGFLVAGPLSGWLSDRYGARGSRPAGCWVAALSFFWLGALPVDFTYWAFAAALFINGFGMGLFASPNRAAIMNPCPPTDAE